MRDFISGTTTYNVFGQLGLGYTNEAINPRIHSENISVDTKMEDVAVVIIKVFNAMQNIDNCMVCMKGVASRSMPPTKVLIT